MMGKHSHFYFLLMLLISACQSLPWSADRLENQETYPRIEAWLQQDIEHQGFIRVEITQRIAKEKQWAALERYIIDRAERHSGVNVAAIGKAMDYYIHGPTVARGEVFSALMRSGEEPLQKRAWLLSVTKPGPEFVGRISALLAEAMSREDMKLLRPEVAEAIRANHIKDAYTFLRGGLNERGGPAFAQAMAELDPAMAQADFLTYLGQASLSDLQQGKIKNIDDHTASAILKLLVQNPPALDHPNFGHLFFCTFLINRSDAENARRIVLVKMAAEPERLAFLLAKMPELVQIKYVEILKVGDPQVAERLFTELRKVTPAPKVIALIDRS